MQQLPPLRYLHRRREGREVNPPSPCPKESMWGIILYQVGWPQLVGRGTKCLGWELPGRERCRQSPGLRLRPDELGFVSSAMSCSLFLGLPPPPCFSLPCLTPACLGMPEGGVGKDEASGCRERRCRLIPTAAFYTMVCGGWHINIIPNCFTNTMTFIFSF